MSAAHDTQALADFPFCGGEASRSKTMDESLWTHDIVPYFKVYCSACEIGTDYRCEGVSPSAEESWNQRASRLQEQEGQPALSDRTPKDYAIEHAEYMAAAAERLSDAVNLLAVAHRDEHDDPDIEKAQEAVDDGLRAVRDRVYEFRKRRDRATLAAGSQAVRVPGWRPVDENYFVSRDGLLKDANGNLLGQWKNDQGYMLVRLSSPRRVERVHRLVAAAFVPNLRGANTVNHIDCNRANNVASNLEWCTQAENLQHSSNLGRMQRDYWVGKRSPNAGLTDEQVRSMRAEYSAGGLSLQKLADKFGVSKRCAGRVINMEVYRDVQ